jgi:1-pyrroline-5-carboxylate dehydrogenase
MEQFIRMLHHVGLPKTDIDFLYSDGPVMGEVMTRGDCRMCLFTGSQAVAEKLCLDLRGRVKLEDAGFDWKVLGPDPSEVEFVAWQSDQDAYGFSGQKCSAQSMLLVHENWNAPGIDIVGRLKEKAEKRNLADLTIGPVLTWTTGKFMYHKDACLAIPGASLAFGGSPLKGHTIPAQYGAVEPTAVRVPIESLQDPRHFETASVELFGPFQVIVDWKEGQLPLVIDLLNRLPNHLTAGIVSNDMHFINEVLGNTISGTTYAGIRARTTAAPQQHWFGPSGDPRSGGIHTPEAIKLCWSSHRELIYDFGPVSKSWKGEQS